MMPREVWRWLVMLSLLLGGLHPSAQGAERSGTLAYPVEDLLTMKQGTIEFWFSVPWDVQQALPAEEYHGLLALFQLPGETGGMSLNWFTGAMVKPTAGLFLSIHSTRTELHGIGLSPFTAPAQEWHHVALTWSENTLTLYLDGVRRAQGAGPANLHAALGTLGAKPLLLGDRWNVNGRMTIDELRLSSVARPAQELGFHGPLQVDPFTTLLEDFETEPSSVHPMATCPRWSINGAVGQTAAPARRAPGRFGTGLALFNP